MRRPRCLFDEGRMCSFERIDSGYMASGIWWQTYECTECGAVEDRPIHDDDDEDPMEFF